MMRRRARLRSLSAMWLVLILPALLFMADPAAAKTTTILAFGDSLSAGFGLAPEAAFPARLEARLQKDGYAVRIINGGVSGDTTAGGLARIDWALGDKPDLVLLELGANDMLRGIDPATVRGNLDAMIKRIQASGAKIMLMGMRSASNWGQDYQRDFDRIFPELAEAHHVPLYPFFLEGVAMLRDLNQADGAHPNERGVAVIVERVAPEIEKLLPTPEPASRPQATEGKS